MERVRRVPATSFILLLSDLFCENVDDHFFFLPRVHSVYDTAVGAGEYRSMDRGSPLTSSGLTREPEGE